MSARIEALGTGSARTSREHLRGGVMLRASRTTLLVIDWLCANRLRERKGRINGRSSV
jgi:hypothetical protein